MKEQRANSRLGRQNDEAHPGTPASPPVLIQDKVDVASLRNREEDSLPLKGNNS